MDQNVGGELVVENETNTFAKSLDLVSDNTIYLIAVACSCAGSFCMSSGLILMKMANIKVEKSKKENKRFYCQIEWLFGLLLLACTNVFNLRKSS